MKMKIIATTNNSNLEHSCRKFKEPSKEQIWIGTVVSIE